MTTVSQTHTFGDTTFSLAGERELIVTRVVDAPRDMVFEVWTNPQHVPQWMTGPEGSSMPVCEIDLRPGGKWHYVWRGRDGSTMETQGVYQEIARPVGLASTESWGGAWPETLNTLILTEDNGRTTITCTVLYPSDEDRENAIGTGMEEGWSRSYDRLDDLLKTLV